MKELKVYLSSIFSDLVSFLPNSYNGKQSFILKKDFKPITVSENDEIYFFHLNYNLNLKQFKIEVSE